MSLLDTSLSDGLHMCNNWDDVPPDQIDTQGNCLSITYLRYADLGQYWGRRIYFPANDGNAIYVNVCSVGAWQGWERITTDVPPQKFSLPLADGWIRVNAAEYWKTQEGVVIVTFRVAPENGAAIDTSPHTIAMLPEGFRPNGYMPHIAVSTMNPGTEIYDASAWVDNTGAIKARTRTSIPQSGGSSPTNWAGFAGTFVFVAAS